MWFYSWNRKGMSAIKYTKIKYSLYLNNLKACKKKKENQLHVCQFYVMHNKNDALLLLTPNLNFSLW